jgi:hypothetical protein
MSTVRTNAILDASGGNTATINSMTPTADSLQGFRNRLINGSMVIDQRNAGASVTPTADSTYTLDRWKTRNGGGAGRFSVIQSSTSAANFPTSVLLTVTTTSSPSGVEIYGLEQDVEGYNMADFGWGTANAQPVSVSFQVRSSLTGTYCVSIRNSAADRSYVAEFTINSADTFETKTITIPAITTGTWLSTNGAGLLFLVCLGSGSSREGTAGSWQSSNIVATSNQVDWINTSGATFYITGVQLEVGSVATPFERRDYGRELALCQRYYEKSYRQSVAVPTNSSLNGFANAFANKTLTGSATNERAANIVFNTSKRAAPTITFYTLTNSTAGSWEDGGGNAIAMLTNGVSETAFIAYNNANVATNTGLSGHWVASIEL